MARTKRSYHITFGPAIPVIPVRDFSKMSLGHEVWRDLWAVIGPSVDRNMSQNHPMWLIIASAYAEGLAHGSAIERERRTEGANAKPEERQFYY